MFSHKKVVDGSRQHIRVHYHSVRKIILDDVKHREMRAYRGSQTTKVFKTFVVSIKNTRDYGFTNSESADRFLLRPKLRDSYFCLPRWLYLPHWLLLINCLSPLIKFVFYYKHFKILHSIISEGYSVISCNVVAKSL